ncbi:MAG: histidine kinase N-terminal 7TM domain-containing protein [Candidatus Binatia bacterium]
MYLILLATAGLASSLLSAYAWRNRRYPGFAYFAVLEGATAWWIACYLGEQLLPGYARLCFALKFPAIATITPSWLIFTLFHIGQRPQFRRWAVAYLWPLLLFPLVATNDTHRLFFTDIVQRAELVGLNGPLFSVHLALTYTYVLVAAPLLVRDWQRRGSVQSLLMLVGSLIPLFGNVLNEVGKASPLVSSYVAYNPTLPGFAFSALFIGWAAVRYRLLDPRPVARDTLFESMPDVVLVLNEHDVVVDTNQAAAALLGRSERDLLGEGWDDIFATADWRSVPHGSRLAVECQWSGPSGLQWFEVQRHNLWDAQGRAMGLLVVGRDITARKRYEEELRAASYRDRLTGLSNRRYFDDEAARLQASREFPVAVFAFDLDGLKQVNDKDGHAAGDDLLQAMAEFLTHFFRAGDRVIRQGGDEFIVLLPLTTADEAERIRSRMAAALDHFNVGRPNPLRFSTGVSVAADAADWSGAINRADGRLYDAKRDAGAVTA